MMGRRELLALAAAPVFARSLRLERSIIFHGRKSSVTYFQPRACALPSTPHPTIFLTVSPVTGDDVFWNLHWSESKDLGVTWSKPEPLPGLSRVKHRDGITEELLVDASPEYHAVTRTLLVLGDNVYYARDGKTQTHVPGERWQQPVYIVRNSQGQWSAPQKLNWDDSRASATMNAGSTQRVTLANGDLLLPLSHAPLERYAGGPLGTRGKTRGFDRAVSVVRCSFDGQSLQIRQVGTQFRLPVKRGLLEPALAACCGRYFLTMRAEDNRGYASVSRDGLAWEDRRPWSWDDGEPLITSTTQQRWLVFDDRLFLVYTRRSAENERVFRWRAPLYMAEVDTQRLRLLRAREQIVFPQVPDARTGNFHAAHITDGLAVILTTEETSESVGWRGDTLLARLIRNGQPKP